MAEADHDDTSSQCEWVSPREYIKRIAGDPAAETEAEYSIAEQFRRGNLPYRYRAGSYFAPLRSPGRARAVKKQTNSVEPIREWIGEWAGSGAVTGKPSLALGGSFQLTLVPRERKSRDSNRGLVITTASGLCGLTYVSMIHRR